MKLNRASIKNTADWQGYDLPSFDLEKVAKATIEAPVWLHMGAGNIFRMFPAAVHQDLLQNGTVDRGITVCECYDEEIVPRIFAPHDNLTIAVTLKADGTVNKKVVASISEAITASVQKERLIGIFTSPSLQMVSFTITEKGYSVADPLDQKSMMGYVVTGLLARYKTAVPPLALVSMDNCSKNGDVLKAAVVKVAEAWIKEGLAEKGFMDYIHKLAFPWSMIDKITPRPTEETAKLLKETGFEDSEIIITTKETWVSSFVMAEECQYLVIEDTFPNGRPPLEKAGVFFTDRKTVEKAEKMKVCTCLNPIHTALAIAGCLLGYPTMSETIKDKALYNWVKKMALKEAMPVVSDPKILNPKEFLEDVLERRIPNPFMKDTPQRIALDTSQKVPIRFGETIKLRRKQTLPEDELEAIPFFFALWARYLTELDDNLNPMPIESDPRAAEMLEHLRPPYNLKQFFSDTTLFGCDLYKNNAILANKATKYFEELNAGKNAVKQTINKYWA
ncbi:MAG: mannitol dehydrogenase family protein [Firmicutes bacterium]|nr:mannitol dehydrogenase family protein [Bacillota bacterium]